MGGIDTAIAVMNEQAARMDSGGHHFKAAIIGEPGEIIKSDEDLYSLIPQKTIMESKGTFFYTTSTLLAVSLDKGANWYFVGVSDMPQEQLKILFPSVYLKLIIPKSTKPVVINQ